VRTIGFEWMDCLNDDLKLFYDYEKLEKKLEKMKDFVSKKQVTVELRDESGTYMYPDSDFCLFKSFPHSRLVFPVLNSNRELNCTCTIVWLIQFWKFANKDIRTSAVYGCFNMTTISFDLMVYNCKFEKRLKACAGNESDASSPSIKSISKYNLFVASKSSSYLLKEFSFLHLIYFVIFIVIFY
jgi:hypothetical protein